jgi:hypothetical protein
MDITKILLAGHTGIEKKTVATKLEEYLPKIQPSWANRIKVVHLEQCIEDSGGGDTRLFAGVKNSRTQRDRWLQGWSLADRAFRDSGATCQILSMHLSFATRDNRFCPADLTAVARWKPDIIFVLVDDIYSVKRRIQLNRYTFSIAQLYGWRTTEQMLADQVGILTGAIQDDTNIPLRKAICESILLAVKTPLLTAAKLIAYPNCRRCYASYPISSTRGNPERKNEINSFRTRIHKIMPTFDPVTIDEKPMVNYYMLSSEPIMYDPNTGPPGHEQEEAHKRWDTQLSQTDEELISIVSEPERVKNAIGEQTNFFPVPIERSEIEELMLPEEGEGYTTVDDQIEFRDIRLIAQSDFVVCYRPYMDGHITGGVNTEIENANMMQKEVIAFVGTDKLKGKTLRAHITKPFKKEDEFWGYLEEIANRSVKMPRSAYY